MASHGLACFVLGCSMINLLLLLVQLELVAIGPDDTYGSDARYYYEAMRSTIKTGKWWPHVLGSGLYS